jgi:AcrR family transcriptional regulator
VELLAGAAQEMAPKPLYRKLKPGPGRSPEEVAAHRRSRIHGAMIELVAAVGYEDATVRDVALMAGVSKPTFYKFFPDKEGCFVATYDLVVRQAAREVLASQLGAADWPSRLRIGVRALFDQFAGAPTAARLALVGAFETGPRGARMDRHTNSLFVGVDISTGPTVDA